LVIGPMACKQQDPNQDDWKKVVYTDTLHQWLNEVNNYEQPLYGEKFMAGYSQKIATGDVTTAIKYLNAYGAVADLAFSYDSLLVATLLQAAGKWEANLSEEDKCNLYYYLGSQYNINDDIKESELYLEKATQGQAITKSHKNMQGFAYIVRNQNALAQFDFANAERHSINGLKLFSETGDLANEGTMYSGLHQIYIKTYSYTEAEKALLKSLQIAHTTKDTIMLFGGYGNMINLQRSLFDTLKTLQYADSLRLMYPKWSARTPMREMYFNFYRGLAALAAKDKNLVEQSINNIRQINGIQNQWEYKHRLNMLSMYAYNQLNYPFEYTPFIDSLYISTQKAESVNYTLLQNVLETQANYFEKNGDLKKALEKRKELHEVRKQITELQHNGRVHSLEKQYEFEKKENIILQQKQEISKRTTFIIILSGTITILLLLAALYYIWQRKKHIQMEKQRGDIFTRQLLQKTEDERKRIASDLHDSVSNNLTVLTNNLGNETTQIKEKLDAVIEEIRLISRNLHPVMFERIGLQQSLEQFIERIQIQNNFLVTADINYKNSLPSEKELQLYRIVQEAISNMIKYAQAIAGKLSIQENNTHILIEIKDNGKGFDVNHTLNGGKAFGLHNILERSKAIGGLAHISSNTSGTKISITIPKI
jgi:signal transduction histidine kinase